MKSLRHTPIEIDRHRRTWCAAPTFVALSIALFASTAWGGIVTDELLYESFEADDVAGYSAGSTPTGWIGATDPPAGFGAGRRGLHDESTLEFSTPYGDQGYELWYGNAAITTSSTTVSELLTADVTYTVTFNVAQVDADNTATYLLQLVAFTAGDSRNDDASGTVLGSGSGTVTTDDMSMSDSIIFTPDAFNAHLGKNIALRLRGQTGQEVVFDNIKLTKTYFYIPAPAALPAGLTLLAITAARRRRRA